MPARRLFTVTADNQKAYYKALRGADIKSVGVVSALGAFIACTTIILMVLVGYMAFRVYLKGKK